MHIEFELLLQKNCTQSPVSVKTPRPNSKYVQHLGEENDTKGGFGREAGREGGPNPKPLSPRGKESVVVSPLG